MQNKQLRIAILGTRGIPARYGGFETFAEEIAQRLVRQGVAVTVFCEAVEGEQPSEYRGVWLEDVASPRLGPLTTIVFDLKCLWSARKRFDVVYMLGYGASLFCVIPRLFGCKVWINMDGLEWARSKWSWAARVYLRIMEGVAMWTPNRIIADADAIQSNLAARYRHMPACSVIPYGAEIVNVAPPVTLLAEWGLGPDSYYLVVCRLEPENYVLDILQGFAASASTLPLIILGNHHTNTPYVAQLLAVQDDRIRFVGTVYDKAKLQALRYHCRAYFHGHSVGGTNPSLLEALGCGNAVIAHDNPFNREVACEAACYFTGSDAIPALVAQIEAEEGRRAAMRGQARKIVAGRYTWEKVTESYLRLLAASVQS
jgi:glycosyltransferase involved in cell wall biosynthesis